MPIAARLGLTFSRREAVALLAGRAAASGAPKSLARFLADADGSAVLLDFATRRVLAAHGPEGTLAPPGSTIKPFALGALLAANKLTAAETFRCPGKLTIAGRQLNCSHPPLDAPVRVETAVAYSCNCFVAHMAERFAPEELSAALQRAGFTHFSPRVRDTDGQRLQALGEEGVRASVADLAVAYRWLALQPAGPVLTGLEGAVEYGTAQLARVAGETVAGKTGSVRTAAGNRIAWFAGFFPSRTPRVAIAVMMGGLSGGGAAAPVAGKILTAYRAGAL